MFKNFMGSGNLGRFSAGLFALMTVRWRNALTWLKADSTLHSVLAMSKQTANKVALLAPCLQWTNTAPVAMWR